MRELNKLSAAGLKGLREGKHSDGGGLWFHRRADGGAQWFLRVVVHGKRREMGLGRYPDVSLKEARENADRGRALARAGIDPIKDRERKRREALSRLHVLKDIAEDAFESRKAELKDDGTAGRWFTPLELHVLPRLGKVPVSEIDQRDIRDTLAPIWHEKADTARKAMNRLSICLRHAAALGLEVDLQATEKAKALLGKQRHIAKNVPSMPWQEVPAFYQSLDDSITELALRLLILTGLRSKPIRFARLDQIESNVWTVPAEMMKGRKDATTEFRVPLSTEALAVIEMASKFERDGFLFPNQRRGVISDATMSRYMERKEIEARPHGFRSSLRTWCAEATDAPWEVAEMCLGHSVGSGVERAYKRTDYLEKRAGLMERWANLLNRKSDDIVRLLS
ncbi:site-specific integrase [uncultured Litoreibacter sp.]|uniref:tyrosine-type recombinase/integrase n=1 Tax=uncultured Litoreibacter sp. TaxID=1392394 RepID=UPI0026138662|nr:site-specific integrase [uncultured Litoreibacter sp.]